MERVLEALVSWRSRTEALDSNFNREGVYEHENDNR